MTGEVRVITPPGRRWLLRFAGRPPTLNRERAGHWRAHRLDTKAYRLMARQQARRLRIPQLDVAEVRSWPTYPSRRSWPDVAAWMPATKAVIDGLVDAGVLPDDGPTVVVRNTFEAPRIHQHAGLIVVLVAADALGGATP